MAAASHASRAVLGWIVFFRSEGARDGQLQVAELQAQGLPGDPQQESGLLAIPTCVLQDAGQQLPVDLPVRFRVEVPDVGPDPLADDERLRAGLCRRWRG